MTGSTPTAFSRNYGTCAGNPKGNRVFGVSSNVKDKNASSRGNFCRRSSGSRKGAATTGATLSSGGAATTAGSIRRYRGAVPSFRGSTTRTGYRDGTRRTRRRSTSWRGSSTAPLTTSAPDGARPTDGNGVSPGRYGGGNAGRRRGTFRKTSQTLASLLGTSHYWTSNRPRPLWNGGHNT